MCIHLITEPQKTEVKTDRTGRRITQIHIAVDYFYTFSVIQQLDEDH